MTKRKWVVSRKGGHTSLLHVLSKNLVAVARVFLHSGKVDKYDAVEGVRRAKDRMRIFLEKYREEQVRKIETTYRRGEENFQGHVLFEVVRPARLLPDELEFWQKTIEPRLDSLSRKKPLKKAA